MKDLRAAWLESAAKPTTLLVDVHQDTSTWNLLKQDPGTSKFLCIYMNIIHLLFSNTKKKNSQFLMPCTADSHSDVVINEDFVTPEDGILNIKTSLRLREN